MTSDLASMRDPPQTLLWLILVLAAVAALMPDQTAHIGDSLAYRALAHQLWQSGVFNNPYFMALYPALIGALGPGWVQLLAGSAISIATVWLAFELALAVFPIVALFSFASARDGHPPRASRFSTLLACVAVGSLDCAVCSHFHVMEINDRA
jgi:hypothetical protein